MARFVFALLIALLFMNAVYAISSLEAQTVAERYLIAKESTEIRPIKLVDYGKDSYWVVTILSHNEGCKSPGQCD
ncbi:MAG: hypothetical protein HYW05_00170 [Candidatus Diapherotrites archaeon]|nr:hypothetical protein [Candidatus Diapherotrites archaeon]